jgi:hypothetical protein
MLQLIPLAVIAASELFVIAGLAAYEAGLRAGRQARGANREPAGITIPPEGA